MFGSTTVMPIQVPTKKRSLLPLLMVLFVFSYGLMTVLIVEQGSVIQTQGNLIKVLGRDSTELWSARGKAIGDQQSAQTHSRAQAPTVQKQAPDSTAPLSQAPSTESPLFQAPSTQAPSTQAPSTQAPSTQAPSNQAPSTHTPSTQAVPQRRSQNRTGKIAKPFPELPPVPASDLSDRRRALNTI
jgi:hypothetical protein